MGKSENYFKSWLAKRSEINKTIIDTNASLIKDLNDAFQAEHNKTEIKVEAQNLNILVTIPNSLLFKSRSSEISSIGTEILREIAKLIAARTERYSVFVGYFDTTPYKNEILEAFIPLSLLRANTITKLLVDENNLDLALVMALRTDLFNSEASKKLIDIRHSNHLTKLLISVIV